MGALLNFKCQNNNEDKQKESKLTPQKYRQYKEGLFFNKLNTNSTINTNDMNEQPSQKIELEDFKIQRKIGSGSFGTIYLVQSKIDNQLYVMKTIKKKHLISDKHKQNCIVEKDILLKSNNPFIVKLYFTFQDKKNLYFILDYVDQGDLYHFLLDYKAKLSDKFIVFLAAQIVLGLKYLHEQNCIYRDLKPENILINKKYYIKLADFGLSKCLKEDDQNQKCQTICGTLYYMAPEIIYSNEGYDQSVDWWSFGILLYELYHGLPPFYQQENQMQILEKYNTEDIEVSKNINYYAQDLITKLLKRDPKERIGYQNVKEIQNHPYFKEIKWQQLSNQNMKPPKISIKQFTKDKLNMTEIFMKDDPGHIQSSYCQVSNFSCNNIQ